MSCLRGLLIELKDPKGPRSFTTDTKNDSLHPVKNRIFSGVTLTLYLGVQEVKMGLKENLTPINGCHDTYQ